MRNHLQQVDDSDTDSVLILIDQRKRKPNLSQDKRNDGALRDITDASDEVSKDKSRNTVLSMNNQSLRKRIGRVSGPDESGEDMEKDALRKSIKKNSDNDKKESGTSSDYSFNDMGDKVQTIRRFRILWPLFWVLYYLFCCCLFQRRRNRNNWQQESENNDRNLISNFQRALRKLKSKKFHENYIYDAIRMLRDGKPEGIRNIEKVRINPDFTQSNMIREDLEFFLPQLCCIYLQNNLSKHDDKRLMEVLVIMSKSSFHFAHRILFFINSNLNSSSIQQPEVLIIQEKQRALLLAIEEASINGSELLYLSNSNQILETALNQGFKHLFQFSLNYFNSNVEKQLSPYQLINDYKLQGEGYHPPKQLMNKNSLFNENLQRDKRAKTFTAVKKLEFGKRTKSMDKFKTNQRNPEVLSKINQLILQDLENKNGFGKDNNEKKISSLQIKLNPYHFNFSDDSNQPEKVEFYLSSQAQHQGFSFLVLNDEIKLLSGTETIKMRRGKQVMDIQAAVLLKSFFSTLNFIKDLTDLSEKVLESQDKMSSLQDGLKLINKQLPATVYIPFVSKSARNHAVLNIFVEESRLFLTKERAPFMICVEIYRPEEINLALKDYKEQMKHEMHLDKTDSDGSSLIRPVKKHSIFQASPAKQVKKQAQKVEKFSRKLDQEISRAIAVGQYKALQSSGLEDMHYFDLRKLSMVSDALNQKQSSLTISPENNLSGVNKISDQVQTVQQIRNQKNYLKTFETEEEDKLNYNKSSQGLNKNQSQLEVQDDKHLFSPQIVTEKKSSMVIALNEYLRQSNDKFFESRDDTFGDAAEIGTNQSKRLFKDEYSFYQNLDRVTDDEHLLKSKTQIRDKLDHKNIGRRQKLSTGPQIMLNDLQIVEANQDKSQNTNSNRESKSNIEDNSPLLINNDLEIGYKGPINEYQVENQEYHWELVEAQQNFLFSETCDQQEIRLRQQSKYGDLKTWKITRLIVKSGDDLRQEQFAMQIISLVDQLFKTKKLKCKLRPYEILATGQGCGIIEFLTDTLSIDFIKRKIIPYGGQTLLDYYMLNFGRKGDKLIQARKNFCYSMAAYSLICYILQIKDRHNANILIDKEGHVVHIDFGFLLTHAPGKTFKFERAPFKLTLEFMQVMGGQTSQGFRRFRTHLIEGFYVIHQNADKILLLVEMIAQAQSNLSCFRNGTQVALDELRQRIQPLTKKDSEGKFMPKIMSKGEVAQHIDQLIFQSYDNWGTNVYDRWQYCCQGIF